MAIRLNTEGFNHAKRLIREGKVDRESEWSFEAEDGNKILEEGGWKEYRKWFLAIDTEAEEETKARYKFPYGKNGKVYRRGVIAAKVRASQFGYDNIREAADELLQMIDKEEEEKKILSLPIQTRTVEIETKAVVDKVKRMVELSFSSEEPVERFFGIEILDHSEESVDLSRLKKGGPLLLDHDPTKQIGVIEDVYIDKVARKGRAVVRLSRGALGEEVFQDILDGIRRNVSVGYIIKEMRFEKEENGKKWYRVTSWVPLEISIVSIPADLTVGVGRTYEAVVKNEVMPHELKSKERRVGMIEVLDQEMQRIDEILALGEKHKCLDLARRAIKEGKTVEEFKEMILEQVYRAKKIEPIDPRIGLSEKEARKFSIVRAINALVERNWDLAPFEKEVSDATAKKLGRTPMGFFIPLDVLETPLVTRDLVKGTAGAGGELVATELLVSEFIELLRNRMMVRKLGARILSGLVGDIAIPKMTGGATAYWVSEGMAPTESQQAFAQVGMTPKTVGAITDISRKLLLQASLSVEALVRDDLATVVALAIDYAAINGSGANGEPTGILNTPGVGLVELGENGGPPTYAKIVELWSKVATQNADVGALAFLTNAKVIATLASTPKVSGYPAYIIEDLPGPDGMTKCLALPCAVSNQVPSNLTKGTGTNLSAMIFGNWKDLIIGEWGALDVMVDPYTQGASGTVRVRVLQDVDIAIRHPQSFAVIKDMVTIA